MPYRMNQYSFLRLLIIWCGVLLSGHPAHAQESRPFHGGPSSRLEQSRGGSAFIPAGVKASRDLHYIPGGSAQQTLDLYVPSGGGGPWPLIVWVHGGGWQSGSKEQCLALRSGLPETGYAIASLNYRLSGEAAFPAQIEDCKAAIRWLRAHAGEYHIDPQHIGVWGSSAGGHLVALLGTSGSVKEFDKGENLDQSSRVQAVCDFYGPSDFQTMASGAGYERHDSPDSPESQLIGGVPSQNPGKAAAASPVTYVNADNPPFLIVHGSKDPVVPPDQSNRLHAALLKAGVACKLIIIPGAKHGGPEFSTPEIQAAVKDFFEKNLQAPKPGA